MPAQVLVLDAATGRSLYGASVFLVDASSNRRLAGTKTDKNGRATFTANIPTNTRFDVFFEPFFHGPSSSESRDNSLHIVELERAFPEISTDVFGSETVSLSPNSPRIIPLKTGVPSPTSSTATTSNSGPLGIPIPIILGGLALAAFIFSKKEKKEKRRPDFSFAKPIKAVSFDEEQEINDAYEDEYEIEDDED